MDRDRMLAAILQRYGVKLEPDDPAFLLVELNRMALEEAAAPVVTSVASLSGRIERTGLSLVRAIVTAFARKNAELLAQTRAEAAEGAASACNAAVAAALRKAYGDIAAENARGARWFIGIASAVGVFGFVLGLIVGALLLPVAHAAGTG